MWVLSIQHNTVGVQAGDKTSTDAKNMDEVL